MAKVFRVSSSEYYAWKGRKPSHRILEDAAHNGFSVSRKRVARLIRHNDLFCIPRRRFQVTTHSRHQEPVAEYILNRQFDVVEPNTVWVSDITYLPTRDGWLYLCVIIDLFDRKVVGWSMRTDMTATIVIDAAESFFKTLKREVDELDGRTSRCKVRSAIFEYIEVYYNRIRLHSRNGYKPPAMVARRGD